MRFCVFWVQSDLKWRQWIFRLLKKYAWRIISVKERDIMERIQKRKNAVAFADAINSIEGVPLSPIARCLSDQWQQEKISSTEMVRALVEHYSALGRK